MKQRIRIKTILLLVITVATVIISSCKKDETEPVTASVIDIVSGNNQTAMANGSLAQPIVVRMRDQYNTILAGATVHFELSDGSVSNSEVVTDAEGLASTEWTLGTSSPTQALIVKVYRENGTMVSLTFVANLGPAVVEIVSGDNQTDLVEAVLGIPIKVIVKDNSGNVYKAGTKINFTVSEGSVSETSAITDSTGNATVLWTLGTTLGTQTLTITAFQADGTTPMTSILPVNATGLQNTLLDYDGNVYKLVLMGNQLWMKENLKVTHYSDGTEIPYITDNTAWANLGDNNTDKAFCYYNNNTGNEAITYGALYTWAAAMNGAATSYEDPSGIQGACPTGWHIPSTPEWQELQMYIGMSENLTWPSGWYGTNQGGKLKETGTAHWLSPNTGATDEFGFSALPGGYRSSSDGLFRQIGEYAWWMSTTEYSIDLVRIRGLGSNTAQMGNLGSDKSKGRSVRCVMDKD